MDIALRVKRQILVGIFFGSFIAWAGDSDWNPQVATGTVSQLYGTIQKYSSLFPDDYRKGVLNSLKQYQGKKFDEGVPALSRTIEANVCTVPGTPEPNHNLTGKFPISPTDSRKTMLFKSMANSNPMAARVLAEENILQIKNRLLDALVKERALKKFNKKAEKKRLDYIFAGRKRPVEGDQARNDHDIEDAVGGAYEESPKAANQRRQMHVNGNTRAIGKLVEKSADRNVAAFDQESARRARDYDKTYGVSVQKSRERLLSQSRESLLKDEGLRNEWEELKNSGLVEVSNTFESLIHSVQNNTTAAIQILSSDVVNQHVRAYAEEWANDLESLDNEGQSMQQAQALHEVAKKIAHDAEAGAIQKSYVDVKVRMPNGSMSSIQDATNSNSEFESRRGIVNAVKLAGTRVAVVGGIVASGFTLAPEGMVVLGALSTTLETVSTGIMAGMMVNEIHEAPGQGWGKFSNNPELFADAILLALPLGTGVLRTMLGLGKVTMKESQIFKMALQQYSRNLSRAEALKKAEAFFEESKKVSFLLDGPLMKPQNAYFAFKSAEAVGMATAACSHGDAKQCVETMSMALLQALPMGIASYAKFKQGCGAYAKPETESRQLAEEGHASSAAETPDGFAKPVGIAERSFSIPAAELKTLNTEGRTLRMKLGENPVIKFTGEQMNSLGQAFKGATQTQVAKIKEWFKSVRAKARSDEEASEAVMKRKNLCMSATASLQRNFWGGELSDISIEIDGNWIALDANATSAAESYSWQ